ncbi:hypothetical protein Back11_33720 [Paenibacillus baekrokdamisoli]|uniref:Uncharacterized protein n=1 Tax=Paenibacillus baekrokdamisoli TaxID=1712516 RepID=A0A3G9IT32_9BACL|nr:AraC family transcriptional regulator [Paenibacillus baekrokdamisoli]MBB3072951.1 YesN/AraC family two-component response regulator [Paenibacillus baekrokdamisoli]BBH22027.1 hypothetical protein Back11_33720 [Paenibacillus baekrokdamisoli]
MSKWRGLSYKLAPVEQEIDNVVHEQPNSKNNWIEEMEQYLQLNFTKNLTLHSLSDHFHLSALYLSREYTRKKKISPLNYQMQLRIEESKRLIKNNPRLLFKHIAVLVGFNDPYYFSKLFKQWTGLTLTEYKNKIDLEM